MTEMLLKHLISVYLKDPSVDYVASGQGEAAVPPVILSKSTFPVLNCLEGDVGARHIFRSPEFEEREYVMRPNGLLLMWIHPMKWKERGWFGPSCN